MVRDGCSEALPGSDVNGTNMQGCHDQSGGDQIDNHNHNHNNSVHHQIVKLINMPKMKQGCACLRGRGGKG